jgi:hypothetical protein
MYFPNTGIQHCRYANPFAILCEGGRRCSCKENADRRERTSKNTDTITRADAEITRQALYVQRNIQARSCNRFCSRKAIGITFYDCVSLALGIQHVMRIRHIVNCGLSGSTIVYSTLSHTRHDFRGGGGY